MRIIPRVLGWTSTVVLIGLMTTAVIVAQKVNVDSNPSAPFSTYKTYAWAPGDSGLESLAQQRLQQGVDQRLAARGLRESTSPDLIVTAHVKTQQRQELIPTGFAYGPWWGGLGYGGAYVETQTEGTLLLDFYDAKTKQMVWRGVATATASDKPTKNAEKMSKALDKLFDKFPIYGNPVSTSGVN